MNVFASLPAGKRADPSNTTAQSVTADPSARVGGWGSGRQGGRVTIEGCGSLRLSISDLRDLMDDPPGTARWMQYSQNGEHRMTRGRGACQPWLRAPAAPVTGLGLHRAHGLHRGPDLDGAPIGARRGASPALSRAAVAECLPAQGRQQFRQRQGPRAGLRRDPHDQVRPGLAPHGADLGAPGGEPGPGARRPGRTGCGPPPTGTSCGYGARPRNAWTPSPMPGSAASWPGSRCPGSGPAWPACWRTLFQREGKSREFDLLSKSLANLLRLWAEV